MKPSEALRINRSAIRRVIEANRARNPRVFGSVVHGADIEGSDLVETRFPEFSLAHPESLNPAG